MLSPRGVDRPSTQLWDRYTRHRDPEARRQLIMRYSSLVGRIWRRVASHVGRRVERGDLVSCGMIGLIDAIEKFRADRNLKFETYATTRIQGAMLDHLRSLDWMPRTLREKKKDFDETFHALQHRLGRTPTEPELAAAMGVQVSRLQTLIRDLHRCGRLSLDGLQNAEIEVMLPDLDDGPEQAAVVSEQRELLVRAMARLPKRERTVMRLYYFEEMTLRQVGRLIGLSEAAVCTIHAASLSRLRAQMRVQSAR